MYIVALVYECAVLLFVGYQAQSGMLCFCVFMKIVNQSMQYFCTFDIIYKGH